MSSASFTRLLSWGEYSFAASSLSYDSRMARIPSLSWKIHHHSNSYKMHKCIKIHFFHEIEWNPFQRSSRHSKSVQMLISRLQWAWHKTNLFFFFLQFYTCSFMNKNYPNAIKCCTLAIMLSHRHKIGVILRLESFRVSLNCVITDHSLTVENL